MDKINAWLVHLIVKGASIRPYAHHVHVLLPLHQLRHVHVLQAKLSLTEYVQLQLFVLQVSTTMVRTNAYHVHQIAQLAIIRASAQLVRHHL